MEGVSLVPALQGTETRADKPIYWEFSGNHAVRAGDWKLVAERSKDWELYHIASDRTETNNLIDEKPEVADRLAKLYDAWATHADAKTHAKCVKMKPSTQPQLFDLEEILSK